MLGINLANRILVRPIVATLVIITLLACDDRKSAMPGATDMSTPPMAPEEALVRTNDNAVGGIGGAQPREDAFAASSALRAPRARSETSPGQSTDIPQQSMIIKVGQATIEVDSLELAIARITQLAQKLGGVVANASIQTGRKELRTASVNLRIPSAQFDAAMSGLSPIGKVESQNVASEDVTEQFVDMTARAKNAKRLEERLINLLATRTGKLEDVLAVERELARVREEIERYEGQLRYLRTRAAISTLTVNLHEKYPILTPPGGSNVIVQAFRSAWRNFVGVVASTISALGVIIPLLLVAIAVAFLLRRFGFLPQFNRPPKDPPSATPQG